MGQECPAGSQLSRQASLPDRVQAGCRAPAGRRGGMWRSQQQKCSPTWIAMDFTAREKTGLKCEIYEKAKNEIFFFFFLRHCKELPCLQFTKSIIFW